MAVQYKDYYKTLGVSESASQDEIKKAFRKLARKHHPDVAEDKAEAEEKIKEINEAYAVLGDEEKRRKYDQLGANWEHAGAGMGGGSWQPFEGAGGMRGFSFDGTGFSDFFEAFFGEGGFRTSGMPGGVSGAYAGDASTHDDPFGHLFGGRPGRSGMGSAPRKGPDVETDVFVTLEEVMHGSTRQLSFRMPDASAGGAETVRSLKVRIPPGVREGQRIRAAGKGQPGPNGGPNGDIYLKVFVEKHPDFDVRERDVYYHLPLAPWEAALGAKCEVPTLDGLITIRIKPGTPSGQKQRLRGKGLPDAQGNRGDFYIVTRIETPAHPSHEERRLWEELRKVSQFNPRE